MAVYVDHVLVGGEPKQAAKHMRGLTGLLNMGRVQNTDRFLRTSYHVNFASHQTVTVTVAQPAHAAMVLQRYATVCATKGPLIRVDTPITDKDPESEYVHLPSKRTDAAVHLSGLFFLIRLSCPDMMLATGFLGRYVSKRLQLRGQ